MKKTIALLLTIFLLVSFIACGQRAVESNAEDSLSQLSSVTAENASDSLLSATTEVASSDVSAAVSSETSQPEQSVLSSNHVVVESTTSSFPLAANSTVSSNSENSQNSVASVIGGTEPDPEDVTSEVMQNALEEFYAFIDSLRTEKIGKIMVSIGNPGGNQIEYATDPELIEKWLEMFRSIKIERVRPYMLNYGGYTDFVIYDREGNVYDSFSSSRDGALNFDYTLTQLVVEEMDEDLLQSLLKEMGFESKYVQGYGYWRKK